MKRLQDQQNLLLTNTMVEIVQTIKQNNAGIRNVPGTALKNAINGEVVYTPPCCEEVLREKLSALEQFINDPEASSLNPLVKMALIHYQFEAIHPLTEKENWNDWIMYMLSALIETTQQTTKKIKWMLSLKSDYEKQIKEVLGTSYSYELLQLMFTLPYLKIDLLVNKEIAHRQTASTWLKKLVHANILRPQKIGRTTYYINFRLMEILSAN